MFQRDDLLADQLNAALVRRFDASALPIESIPAWFDPAGVSTRDIIAHQSRSAVYHVARESLGVVGSGTCAPTVQSGSTAMGVDASAFTPVQPIHAQNALAIKVVQCPQAHLLRILDAIANECAVLVWIRRCALAERFPRIVGIAAAQKFRADESDPEAPSVVMVALSFIRACPLNKLFIENPRGLQRAFVKSVVLQLSFLLESLHSIGVVYRDLKLPNVLVAPDGLVFLVDFGSAVLVHGVSSAAAAFSPTEHVMPHYERASMQFADDVYAMGIATYEVAFGIPAFGEFARSKDDRMRRTIEKLTFPRLAVTADENAQRSELHLQDFIRQQLRLDDRVVGDSDSVADRWAAIRAHPLLKDTVPAANGVLDMTEYAYEASAPYGEEIDMQLLGF
jgi:serine/threonine protein kinase